MRNIYGNEELSKSWSELSYFWGDTNYLDTDISKEELSLLKKLAINTPGCIGNLKGMKLSEQLNLISNLFDKFKDDPLIAISILENIKLDKDIILDDQTALLLELSVRKEIVNDTRGKVYKKGYMKTTLIIFIFLLSCILMILMVKNEPTIQRHCVRFETMSNVEYASELVCTEWQIDTIK